MYEFFAVVFVSYLIGAIPTGFLLAKYIKGIDIRKAGSGNVGATNVYRVVGKMPGVAVLLLDILKGALPVYVLGALFKDGSGPLTYDMCRIIIGGGAISGHIWTVFLNFRGGKGVATAAGVLMVLSPKVVGIALSVWLVMFVIFRYVSLASISAAVVLPIAAFFLDDSRTLVIFFLVLGCVGIYKHKSNIERLLHNKENRF